MVQAAKNLSNSTRKKTAYWFVARGQSVSGPYTSDQLHDRISQGKTDLGDYCWKQGFSEWRPLSSVAQLELSSRPCLVSPYPSAPLPTVAPRKLRRKRVLQTQSGAVKRPLKGNPWEQDQRQKPVTVRLQKQNSRAVNHWERVGMVLFAFAMAWLATVVALKQTQEGFEYLWDQTLVGQEQIVHAQEIESTDHWKWQWVGPLMSAPGLNNLADDYAIQFEARVLRPVVSRHDSTEPWTWKGKPVQWNSGQPYRGLAFRHETDPVYVQPYTLSLQWRASETGKFKATSPGYPGL